MISRFCQKEINQVGREPSTFGHGQVGWTWSGCATCPEYRLHGMEPFVRREDGSIRQGGARGRRQRISLSHLFADNALISGVQYDIQKTLHRIYPSASGREYARASSRLECNRVMLTTNDTRSTSHAVLYENMRLPLLAFNVLRISMALKKHRSMQT